MRPSLSRRAGTRCPRPSSAPSSSSTSSTALCAPCSSTTCRHPDIRAARSRRGVLPPRSCSTHSSTTSPIPIARTQTSCRTPPATRRWDCTRCGPCATRSPGWPRPSSCPAATDTACVSRTFWGFAATRPPPRRSFGACTPEPSTGTPRRRRPSCAWRPGPREWVWRAPSAWPSPPATVTGQTARSSTSRRVKADSRRDASPRLWQPPARPRLPTSCCTSTGTRPRSTATVSVARAAWPATTCSGIPVSSFTCTTGTWCRSPTATTSSRSWRPSATL